MATLTSAPRKSMHWTTMLRQMLRFRLARRLFLVVFAAIVLIEVIIVFPSYSNFKARAGRGQRGAGQPDAGRQ
jgi:hypothetical protein